MKLEYKNGEKKLTMTTRERQQLLNAIDVLNGLGQCGLETAVKLANDISVLDAGLHPKSDTKPAK